MADNLVAALSGEEVLKSNPLAVVTNNWVIVRPARGRARVMIGLSTITDVRRVRTTHPAFLVIASGFFLVAAGAYYSKDSTAALPLAFLGLLFLGAYFVTRRGSVIFTAGWEVTETGLGSLRDTSDLIKTVRTAQKEFDADGLAVSA